MHGHLHHHHYHFKQFLRLFHYIYVKLPIVTSNYSCTYYAHECPIIPELFSLKLQPIIPKIMPAY